MTTLDLTLLEYIAPSAYKLEGEKFTIELSTSEACLVHEALIIAAQLPDVSEVAVEALTSLALFVKTGAQVAENFDPDEYPNAASEE